MGDIGSVGKQKIGPLVAASTALWACHTAYGGSVFTLEGPANFGSDPVKVQFELKEVGVGDIQFTIDVLPETFYSTGNIGDLRGIFFDISDDSLLDGLSVTGDDVTDSAFDADNVIDLGNGANVSGSGNRSFDAGVEIGRSGLRGGGDDFQSTVFVLSHDTENLDLSLFDPPFFGARLTSVGPVGSDREGSSKLRGPGTPPVLEPTLLSVPTPSAALAGITGLTLLISRRRR